MKTVIRAFYFYTRSHRELRYLIRIQGITTKQHSYTNIYKASSKATTTYREKTYFHARVELRRAVIRHRPIWKEFSTHVFGGSVSGDLLKLAADHLRPSLGRFLALVPYPDHSHYERHHRDNTDQQRQRHDLATGRYYHRHFSLVFPRQFPVSPPHPLGIVAKSV